MSSRTGDRSEQSNRNVVDECLNHPELLGEIAGGLSSPDAALAGDCAEVLTHIAEQHPDWVAPFINDLSPLLHHKTTRVRWEATHALALVALHAPARIALLLPVLAELIRADSSVIVRDYAVDAIANYAGSDQSAAERAYPLLRQALTAWDGRHAARALRGLVNVAKKAPAFRETLHALAKDHSHSTKGSVRKVAKDLLRASETRLPR